MADVKISALTTDSAPDNTADYVPTYDASAGATKKTLLRYLGGLTFQGGAAASNPVDATTYYLGTHNYDTLSTTDGAAGLFFAPRAMTIVKVYFRIAGGSGTAETSSIYIRNSTSTDSLISSAFATNTTTGLSYSVSIAIAAEDYFRVKW